MFLTGGENSQTPFSQRFDGLCTKTMTGGDTENVSTAPEGDDGKERLALEIVRQRHWLRNLTLTEH